MDDSLFEHCGVLPGLEFDFLLDPLGDSDPLGESDVNSASHDTTVRVGDPQAGDVSDTLEFASERSRKRRFEQRQQARSDTLQIQLERTNNELRELKLRQHKLEERNVLLEKVAQINSLQKSEQLLVWEGRQAVLDFPCAHTEPTDHGFTLTLTIFGQAESKLAVGVSKMPMSQMATIWKEYISKLSISLLSLQQDQHGAGRGTLDRWVAEARALVCCVRAYNPEALKALETRTLNKDDALENRPSTSFYHQQLEMMMLADAQVSDLLILHRLQGWKGAEYRQQREAVLSELAAGSTALGAQRQHPSDSLALTAKLHAIGLEEYKLHGLVYDAMFHGVLTSLQSALQLVHAYPYLIEPTPLLEALAEKQKQSPDSAAIFSPSRQQTSVGIQWDAFLVYVSKVTSQDCFDYVPMLPAQNPFSDAKPRSLTSVLAAQQRAAQNSLPKQGLPKQGTYSSQQRHLPVHPSQPTSPLQQPARSSPHLQDTSITVPTLEALLDDATVWSGGPNLRRGFNHADAMPKEHALVNMLCKGLP